MCRVSNETEQFVGIRTMICTHAEYDMHTRAVRGNKVVGRVSNDTEQFVKKGFRV